VQSYLNIFDDSLLHHLDFQEGEEEENVQQDEDANDPLLEGEEKEGDGKEHKQRKTSKFMTKYERARILGTRALQIRFVTLQSIYC